jgi:hypothetical protein
VGRLTWQGTSRTTRGMTGLQADVAGTVDADWEDMWQTGGRIMF